jgi:peptidyl-prolyl cis-trans isomerase SurA
MRTLRTILLSLALLPFASPAAEDVVDGIAAIVDNEIILRSEVERATQTMLSRVAEQQGPVPQTVVAQVRRQALDSLIDERLILQFAKQAKMTTSDEEIDAAIQAIAADENVTPEQIYAAAEQQGLGRDAYREELGKQITKMRVLSGSVQSRVSVTDEEVRSAFEARFRGAAAGERIRVLHILLPWPPPSSTAAPGGADRASTAELAAQLRERAVAGEDFAALAREHSAAPSASQGGITVFREGEAPPIIAAALAGLPSREVTPVIETEHGLNLFQILDRFDPSSVRFEDAEPRLRAELLERKTMPELDKWLAELREGRYVEIVPAELR